MRTNRSGGLSGVLLAAGAALGLLVAAASGPVSAGILTYTTPDYSAAGPGPWNVGTTFSGTIKVGNRNISTPTTQTVAVNSIRLTPSCGVRDDGGFL